MIMRELMNLNQKEVTNLDLVLKFIFGDSYPTPFEPGKQYYAGDMVYVRADNTIYIYRCNINGTYQMLTLPQWSRYSLQELLELIGLGPKPPSINKDENPEKAFKTYAYSFRAGDARVEIPDAESDDLAGMYLPFVFNKDTDHMYLYIGNGRSYIPSFDYTISEDGKYIDVSHMNNDYNTCIGPDETIYIILERTNTSNSRLIKHFDGSTIVNKSRIINIPMRENLITNSIMFDLYINGKFIPETQYTIDQYNTIVTLNSDVYVPDNYQAIFSFTYSLSNRIFIVKNEYTLTPNENNCYRVDLDDVGVPTGDHQVKLFTDGNILDPTGYTVIKNILSIYEKKNYLTIGKYTTIDLLSHQVLENDKADGDLVKHNSVQYVIDEDTQKKFVVPYVEFDDDRTTVHLYNEAGCYIASSKYYIENGILNFYEHDPALEVGDIMNIVLMSNSDNVKVYSKFIDVEEDNQMNFQLPIKYFNEDKMKIMLFRIEGSFISPSLYQRISNTISLNRNIELMAGDRIEVVIIEYISSVVDVLNGHKSYIIQQDGQVSIPIPFNSYDVLTDTLLLFRDDGMYIGNSFFKISKGNIILDPNMTPLTKGQCVDMFLIRELNEGVSIDNIKSVENEL